jgi:hypothetical protein
LFQPRLDGTYYLSAVAPARITCVCRDSSLAWTARITCLLLFQPRLDGTHYLCLL